jgi:hypothetical protein
LHKSQLGVKRNDKLDALAHFALDLIWSTEDVRIVLAETAQARQPAQCATQLVAMQRTKIGETHRQFATSTPRCQRRAHATV